MIHTQIIQNLKYPRNCQIIQNLKYPHPRNCQIIQNLKYPHPRNCQNQYQDFNQELHSHSLSKHQISTKQSKTFKLIISSKQARRIGPTDHMSDQESRFTIKISNIQKPIKNPRTLKLIISRRENQMVLTRLFK